MSTPSAPSPTPTPDPPSPFDPLEETLDAGTVAYRCHDLTYGAAEPNPGPKGAGRFHFFGDPMVPALYAAESMTGALCESILRYRPTGVQTLLPASEYRNRTISTLQLERDLRFAVLHGEGLYRLRVHQDQLTNTPGTNYPQTRKWAEAAYDAGFDGIIWMSHQLNNTKSWMVFGDRVPETDFTVAGALDLSGSGFGWLVDTCAAMKVDVMPPF